MPKFGCKCGHVINLSEIPSAHEGVFISEESLHYLVEENGNLNSDILFDYFYEKGVKYIKCSKCGRFYLNEDNGDDYFSYKKEE